MRETGEGAERLDGIREIKPGGNQRERPKKSQEGGGDFKRRSRQKGKKYFLEGRPQKIPRKSPAKKKSGKNSKKKTSEEIVYVIGAFSAAFSGKFQRHEGEKSSKGGVPKKKRNREKMHIPTPPKEKKEAAKGEN